MVDRRDQFGKIVSEIVLAAFQHRSKDGRIHRLPTRMPGADLFIKTVAQKMRHTKCPNKPISTRPPMPQIQNKKLPVNFGELISFLSMFEV
jgi:hypothetical protein